jgi:hypothetical protein
MAGIGATEPVDGPPRPDPATVRRRLLIAFGALAAVAALFWFVYPRPAPLPDLLRALPFDGMRGAPCPARDLIEQDAQRKQGAKPPAHLGERLRQLYPLGSNADELVQRLQNDGFVRFTPCPNDDSIEGARYLSRDWLNPDAFVYWRRDDKNHLIFLDGHATTATN